MPSTTNPEQNVNFRSLLLTTCQKEFEKDSENEQKILDKKALLKKAESVSISKFQFLECEISQMKTSTNFKSKKEFHDQRSV